MSTTTITKNDNKTGNIRRIKTERDEKTVRREMLEEMRAKDLVIKDLKESLLKLKVSKNTVEIMEMNIMQLDTIREETRMADRFIKTIMQSNIANYDIVDKMSKEDRDISKKSEEKKHKEGRSFIQGALDKMNFKSCTCSTCSMNRMMAGSMASMPSNSVFKGFNLTNKLAMGAHFDSNKVRIRVKNSTSDNKTQEVSFQDRKTLNSLVTLKMTWKKGFLDNTEDLDFGKHKKVDFNLNMEDTTKTITLSAFLVCTSMRNFMEDSLISFMKSDLVKDVEGTTCFAKFFKDITNMDCANPFSTSITDLTFEEEAHLLTNHCLESVYILCDKGEFVSKKNHISKAPFKDSVKTTIKMLSTPDLRNMSFFSKEEEEMIDIMDNMDVQSISSEESTEVTVHNDGMKEMKKAFSLKPEMARAYGKITGSFYSTIFHKRNNNKGFDQDMLKELEKSYLSANFLNSDEQDITWLFLYNMSFNTFLGLYYFSKDQEGMTRILISRDLNVVKQMVTIMKKMFFDEFYYSVGNMENETIREMGWIDFLKALPDMPIFQNKFYPRMHEIFKTRVANAIMLFKASKEIQFEINGKFSRMSIGEKDSASEEKFYKHFLSNVSNRVNKEITDISNYQPSLKMREFGNNMAKLVDAKILDVKNNSDLIDRILDLETKASE